MIAVEREQKQRGGQRCEVEAAGPGMSHARSPGERDCCGGDAQRHDGNQVRGAVVLPNMNGGAVEPAERGEEYRHRGEFSVRAAGARPRRRDARGSEDDAHGQLAWKANARTGQMHDQEVEEEQSEDGRIVAAWGGRHRRDDEREQGDARAATNHEECAAMACVEEMPLAQILAAPVARAAVQQAIRDIDDPCAQAEHGGCDPGKRHTRGVRESPRPEHRNGGRIQAEEMPVNQDAGQAGAALLFDGKSWSGYSHTPILEVKVVANLSVNLAWIIFMEAAEGEAVVQQHAGVGHVGCIRADGPVLAD